MPGTKSQPSELPGSGEADRAAAWLTQIYAELRRLAAGQLGREAAVQTLQPTALVHEAWLRLGGDAQPAWPSPGAFFSAAAEAMRRILVDRARRRRTQKHGANAEHVPASDVEIAGEILSDERLLALSEALEQLAAAHPRKAELVKLRYFAGMTFEEAAQVLGIAVPTAKEWWAFARAWLRVHLSTTSGS